MRERLDGSRRHAACGRPDRHPAHRPEPTPAGHSELTVEDSVDRRGSVSCPVFPLISERIRNVPCHCACRTMDCACWSSRASSDIQRWMVLASTPSIALALAVLACPSAMRRTTSRRNSRGKARRLFDRVDCPASSSSGSGIDRGGSLIGANLRARTLDAACATQLREFVHACADDANCI